MKSRFLFSAAVVMASICAFSADGVLDYVLAAGESTTLSAAGEYGTMSISGDLTVTGGVTNNVDSINLSGGTITVIGAYTTLGKSHGDPAQAFRTAVSLSEGENGAYGKIMVKDTGSCGDTGFAATEFNILRESEGFESNNGYFDFLFLENGSANLRNVCNESSCTGRITVTGTSAIYKRWPRAAEPIFAEGAYHVNLVDDATLVFDFADLGGYLNSAGCSVRVGGTGTVRLKGSRQSSSLQTVVRKGAVFNHAGPVEFVRYDNKRNCYFALADSDIIGPNVTAMKHTNGSLTYVTRIRITENETITLCGDLEITGVGSYLYGDGGARLKIDATAASRSFKCNIWQGDHIVIEKVGVNEMVVSATTNIPNLVVSEGAVRFTEDCRIENLTIGQDAKIVADGCAVTILADRELIGEIPFNTVNGGKFIKGGEDRTVIYDPASLPDVLHVARGELAFSAYGLDHKWWRWTFFSVNGGPKPLAHRGLYLFAANDEWQSVSPGIVNAAHFDNPPTEPLEARKCRWWYHSETNIVAANLNYCNIEYMRYWFHYSKPGNNISTLSSPVINTDDPRSYVGVEVCLPSTAKPIVGYNMRTHRETQYANGWKLEASRNGLDWETVDIRSNQIFEINGTYRSYDDMTYMANEPNTKELFHLTGYRRGGLVAGDPVSVQVDDGAILDLLAFDEGQPIDSVTIDCAEGGGTVKGGKVAANGTLVLVNAEESGLNLENALPILFDGIKNAENFTSWTVIVDGRKTNRKVGYSDGRITILPPGLVILVK